MCRISTNKPLVYVPGLAAVEAPNKPPAEGCGAPNREGVA